MMQGSSSSCGRTAATQLSVTAATVQSVSWFMTNHWFYHDPKPAPLRKGKVSCFCKKHKCQHINSAHVPSVSGRSSCLMGQCRVSHSCWESTTTVLRTFMLFIQDKHQKHTSIWINFIGQILLIIQGSWLQFVHYSQKCINKLIH